MIIKQRRHNPREMDPESGLSHRILSLLKRARLTGCEDEPPCGRCPATSVVSLLQACVVQRLRSAYRPWHLHLYHAITGIQLHRFADSAGLYLVHRGSWWTWGLQLDKPTTTDWFYLRMHRDDPDAVWQNVKRMLHQKADDHLLSLILRTSEARTLDDVLDNLRLQADFGWQASPSSARAPVDVGEFLATATFTLPAAADDTRITRYRHRVIACHDSRADRSLREAAATAGPVPADDDDDDPAPWSVLLRRCPALRRLACKQATYLSAYTDDGQLQLTVFLHGASKDIPRFLRNRDVQVDLLYEDTGTAVGEYSALDDFSSMPASCLVQRFPCGEHALATFDRDALFAHQRTFVEAAVFHHHHPEGLLRAGLLAGALRKPSTGVVLYHNHPCGYAQERSRHPCPLPEHVERRLGRYTRAAVLQMETGSGKTRAVLVAAAECARIARQPSLVLVPDNLLHNRWQAEADRVRQALRATVVVVGAARELTHAPADVIVVTRNVLRSRRFPAVCRALGGIGTVFVDEFHSLFGASRRKKSSAFQALFAEAEPAIPHTGVVCVSATPDLTVLPDMLHLTPVLEAAGAPLHRYFLERTGTTVAVEWPAQDALDHQVVHLDEPRLLEIQETLQGLGTCGMSPADYPRFRRLMLRIVSGGPMNTEVLKALLSGLMNPSDDDDDDSCWERLAPSAPGQKLFLDVPCPICLTEPADKHQPTALSFCGHVLCYPCLRAYQKAVSTRNSCPLRCKGNAKRAQSWRKVVERPPPQQLVPQQCVDNTDDLGTGTSLDAKHRWVEQELRSAPGRRTILYTHGPFGPYESLCKKLRLRVCKAGNELGKAESLSNIEQFQEDTTIDVLLIGSGGRRQYNEGFDFPTAGCCIVADYLDEDRMVQQTGRVKRMRPRGEGARTICTRYLLLKDGFDAWMAEHKCQATTWRRANLVSIEFYLTRHIQYTRSYQFRVVSKRFKQWLQQELDAVIPFPPSSRKRGRDDDRDGKDCFEYTATSIEYVTTTAYYVGKNDRLRVRLVFKLKDQSLTSTLTRPWKILNPFNDDTCQLRKIRGDSTLHLGYVFSDTTKHLRGHWSREKRKDHST